ncbi:MAG: hypothetical protein AAFR75_06645, partial [Pseudomonadota bacterium]
HRQLVGCLRHLHHLPDDPIAKGVSQRLLSPSINDAIWISAWRRKRRTTRPDQFQPRHWIMLRKSVRGFALGA